MSQRLRQKLAGVYLVVLHMLHTFIVISLPQSFFCFVCFCCLPKHVVRTLSSPRVLCTKYVQTIHGLLHAVLCRAFSWIFASSLDSSAAYMLSCCLLLRVSLDCLCGMSILLWEAAVFRAKIFSYALTCKGTARILNRKQHLQACNIWRFTLSPGCVARYALAISQRMKTHGKPLICAYLSWFTPSTWYTARYEDTQTALVASQHLSCHIGICIHICMHIVFLCMHACQETKNTPNHWKPHFGSQIEINMDQYRELLRSHMRQNDIGWWFAPFSYSHGHGHGHVHGYGYVHCHGHGPQ